MTEVRHSDANQPLVDLRSLPGILFRSGVSDSQALANWDLQIDNEVRKRNTNLSSHDSHRPATTTASGSSVSGFRKRPHSESQSDQPDNAFTRSKTSSSSGFMPSEPQGPGDAALSELSFPSSMMDDEIESVRDPPTSGTRIGIAWPNQPEPSDPNESGVIVAVQPMIDFENLHTLDSEQHRALMESLDKQSLVAYSMRQHNMVKSQQETITALKRELKSEKQRSRRAMQTLTRNKEKLHALKNPDITDLDVFRGNAKKLSWRGSVSLGLRKSIAYVSASSFPMSSLLDIGRQTVTRCEVLVGAYIMMRSLYFHRILYMILKRLASIQSDEHAQSPDTQPAGSVQDLGRALVPGGNVHFNEIGSAGVVSHFDAMSKDFELPSVEVPISQNAPMMALGDDEPFCLGCTFFAGDATNAAIWRRQKLQGLMVTTGIMLDSNALKNTQYRQAFRSSSWV